MKGKILRLPFRDDFRKRHEKRSKHHCWLLPFWINGGEKIFPCRDGKCWSYQLVEMDLRHVPVHSQQIAEYPGNSCKK